MGDIRQATQLARHMVRDWGMNDRLGFVYYGDDDSRPNLRRLRRGLARDGQGRRRRGQATGARGDPTRSASCSTASTATSSTCSPPRCCGTRRSTPTRRTRRWECSDRPSRLSWARSPPSWATNRPSWAVATRHGVAQRRLAKVDEPPHVRFSGRRPVRIHPTGPASVRRHARSPFGAVREAKRGPTPRRGTAAWRVVESSRARGRSWSPTRPVFSPRRIAAARPLSSRSRLPASVIHPDHNQ